LQQKHSVIQDMHHMNWV